ncbi:MAG: hypothetical protein H7X77_01725, partial [Anaerolineae bacterium]|nr:hypothetical protein [Anaerolineae bacterium]
AENEPLLEILRPYAEVISISADSTSTFENIYTPEGRVQYIRGVAAKLNTESMQSTPPEWLAAPLVHLAPLTDEVDPTLVDLFPDATIIVTLQGWLRRWGEDGHVRFKRWHDAEALKRLDVIVFSNEDISEAPDMEAEMVREARHVFVTQAEQGGIHYNHGQPKPYPTPQVEVVHPTGAGDVFATSLLCAWYRLKDWDAAARVAAILAANSVTRVGLESAPTVAEVEAAFKAVGN